MGRLVLQGLIVFKVLRLLIEIVQCGFAEGVIQARGLQRQPGRDTRMGGRGAGVRRGE